MKPANASAMRSTTDPVSDYRHIRSPDELTLSLRPSQSRMSWRPGIQHVIRTSSEAAISRRAHRKPLRRGGSACGGRNRQCQFRMEHSGKRDFVKLISRRKEIRGHNRPRPKESVFHGSGTLSPRQYPRVLGRCALPRNVRLKRLSFMAFFISMCAQASQT